MRQKLYLFGLSISCFKHFIDASDGDLGERRKIVDEDHLVISPTLEPKSDGRFFGKDYPSDKRPKADVLHFKHPYPVVQDSNDFDRDYIKDENSDNGVWKAQTEYDRLRNKLTKERADIARTLAAKRQAEKELQEAMVREKDAKHKLQIAIKKHRGSVQGSRGETEAEHHYEKVEEPPPSPGGVAAPGVVNVATSDTQKAMDALEECKKQLAEAREKLKTLMNELEEAEHAQRGTQAALDASIAHQKALEARQKTLEEDLKKEYQQYMNAREEYLKQQATVAKMEQDIKAAAANVKSMRDGMDKGGGVYPAPSKSSAQSYARPFFVLALVAFTAAAWTGH